MLPGAKLNAGDLFGRKRGSRLCGDHLRLIHQVKSKWLEMRRALRHNLGTLRSIRRSEFHRLGRESHSHSTNRTWVRPILHPKLLCAKHQSDGSLTAFAMRVAMG